MGAGVYVILLGHVYLIEVAPAGRVVLPVIRPPVLVTVWLPGVVVVVLANSTAKSLRVLHLHKFLAAYRANDFIPDLSQLVGLVFGFHRPANICFVQLVHCFLYIE